jgi:hypothetical protein
MHRPIDAAGERRMERAAANRHDSSQRALETIGGLTHGKMVEETDVERS